MQFLSAIGGLLILIGTIWMVVLSIQTGKTTGEKIIWAVVNFLCQPISGIIFFFVKKVGLVPLLIIIVGVVLYAIGVPAMMQNLPR